MRRLLPAAVAALLLVPAAASAQDVQEHDPVIPPGAKAAGQDVGNLTLTQAAALLEDRFRGAMDRRVEVRVAGRRLRAGIEQLGFQYDPLATARRANIAARRAEPAPDGTYPVDVPLHVSWNEEALAAFAVKVDRRSRVRARNARLRITLRRMVIRRHRPGLSVNAERLQQRIARHLQDPEATRILRAERWKVRPRTKLKELRDRHSTVVTIDRSGFRLRLFKRLRYKKYYGIAVGLPDYPTPTGRYTIQNKAVDPAWSAPDEPWAGAYRNEVVEGGSAENPLKARWLGIVGGVGIHGTAAEYSIGTRASHGCIRMRVADVIDLYPRVPVGADVLIR